MHFFADDPCNGVTYRFTAAGGDASAPDEKTTNLLTHGLALKGGIYYGNSSFPFGSGAGLYRFDPNTLGTMLVTNFPLVDPLKLVLGIAGDPLTTDLYVSTTSGLFRVQNPSSASPTITNLGGCFDGIAWTADGSRFYGAVCGSSLVFGFVRATAQTFLVDVGHSNVDGIAIALDHTTQSGIDVSNNVFVNNNDGTIVRIDVNNGNAVSVVASGGSRGDFETVGPDNCLYVTQSDRVEKISPCFFQPSNNTPPDCSKAVPSLGTLWAPSHKFVPVDIFGVTDPDQDQVSLNITSIRQDEPVQQDGTGSGNTCSDGKGVGTPTALLRGERDGTGDGRVYHIGFNASDGHGESCIGEVTVCVPHDLANPTCVDQGAIYDSTMCP
jgi:hypothetical protein